MLILFYLRASRFRPRPVQQNHGEFGRRDAFGRSTQKLNVEHFFQPHYAAREGRLRHSHKVRRAVYAAAVDDRGQMPQPHEMIGEPIIHRLIPMTSRGLDFRTTTQSLACRGRAGKLSRVVAGRRPGRDRLHVIPPERPRTSFLQVWKPEQEVRWRRSTNRGSPSARAHRTPACRTRIPSAGRQ